jgi:hypothetical protein
MVPTLPTRIFPIGIQSFEQLRTNNYVYVDKTDWVYQLTHTNQIYFLSRPRRFGKSLLLSTLKAYFEGKRHLFEGLAIEKLEQEWTAYPVLHISFAQTRYNAVENLHDLLDEQLSEWEANYQYASKKSFGLRFKNVIQQAYHQTGKPVVILIDEYDSPILDSTANTELRTELRNIMREFFSPLKDNTKFIRFLFITGITKFSQLSIFSELNNLKDISMAPRYSAICGITERELFSDLKDSIELLAEANEETYTEACTHLKRMYDGYHFAQRSEDIYNPFSIINVLAEQVYGSYWYATGTPTFIVELLKERSITVSDLDACRVGLDAFDKSTEMLTDPLPVLYQSGYLTIKDYRDGIYTLGFPNEEVRLGFIRSLLPLVSKQTPSENSTNIVAMMEKLNNGDIEACMTRIRSFVASIPYEKKSDNESRFEIIFYMLFTLMGQFVRTQVHTAIGRADAIVFCKQYIYVLELKVDASAEEALAQINKKGYAIAYEADGRKVVKVGINYDKKMRSITGWKVE